MTNCLNCNVSENEKPLLEMKFQGNEIRICPQCLPILIHKPANLAGKLSGAENFGNAAHHH
jgi:hypothetical protein